MLSRFLAIGILLCLPTEKTSSVDGFRNDVLPRRRIGYSKRPMVAMRMVPKQIESPVLSLDAASTVFRSNSPTTRRAAFAKASIPVVSAWAAIMTTSPNSADAASKIPPDTAYQNLLKARDELVVAAKKYLPTKDYEGLHDYLEDEAANINNFEANAQALLTSNRLDNESKKAIGTIRTYGVGADVLIMYGGLRAAIDDNDSTGVPKYLTRTLDSLQEVIVICRNNGFD